MNSRNYRTQHLKQEIMQIVSVPSPFIFFLDKFNTNNGQTLRVTLLLTLDRPVRVDVLLLLGAGHALLPGARAVLDVVRVQPHLVVGVHQLDRRAARHLIENKVGYFEYEMHVKVNFQRLKISVLERKCLSCQWIFSRF